jgi:hypothetical protein
VFGLQLAPNDKGGMILRNVFILVGQTHARAADQAQTFAVREMEYNETLLIYNFIELGPFIKG